MQPHNLTRDELLNQITTTALEQELNAQLEDAMGEMELLDQEIKDNEASYGEELRTLNAALEECEKENDRLTALLELV